MAIQNYVEQILESPIYIFDNILDQLVGKNMHFAKIELSRHALDVDNILVESIKSILKDLEVEEGRFSKFLYRKFGFQLRKNKRREQLMYLGSELKTQHSKMKNRLNELYRQKEHLTYNLIDLGHLREALQSKDMFFSTERRRNKNMFYIEQIGKSISDIQHIQLLLLMRFDTLNEIERIYKKVFMSIPRNDFLQEETCLLLAKPSKD